MADTTKIEWADKTWSPWIGCTKVSAGCAHCYAESHAKRTGQAVWGPSGTRVKTSESYWKKPLAWNAAAAKAGTRLRVFPSLCDPFEEWTGPIVDSKGRRLWIPEDGYIFDEPEPEVEGFSRDGMRPLAMSHLRERLFRLLVDYTPNIDWLFVTKRAENASRMWPWMGTSAPMFPGAPGKLGQSLPCFARNAPRNNVWIITSVEDQASADARIPELLKLRDLVPVLGVSYEPALGPVDLAQSVYISPRSGGCIDWLIVGGESGPKARPCDLAWIRSAVEQCRAAGTARTSAAKRSAPSISTRPC